MKTPKQMKSWKKLFAEYPVLKKVFDKEKDSITMRKILEFFHESPSDDMVKNYQTVQRLTQTYINYHQFEEEPLLISWDFLAHSMMEYEHETMKQEVLKEEVQVH